MAVPKRRTSKARKGKRRSHQHVKEQQYTYCGESGGDGGCGEPVLNHYLCSNCGWSNTQKRYLISVDSKKES